MTPHPLPTRRVIACLIAVLMCGCDYQGAIPADAGKDATTSTSDSSADTIPTGSCSAIASGAREVLIKHCAACHQPGGEGANASKLDTVLDVAALTAGGGEAMVIPGNSSESLLYLRVFENTMPPRKVDVRPTPAEVALLDQWIGACQALDFNPPRQVERIPMSDMLDWMRRDLETFSPATRRSIRYISLAHLHNAGVPPGEIPFHVQAVSVVLNSLSWNREIVPVRGLYTLDQARSDSARITLPALADTILRIDLRDFEWQAAARVCESTRAFDAWEELVSCNPYPIPARGSVLDALRADTGTRAPYVHADWLVFAASRPPLYQSMLALPSTLDELEASCLGIDSYSGLVEAVLAGTSDDTIVRSGFDGSGVSAQNRLIERLDSGFGAPYWKSYDFNSSTGRASLKQFPLGPAGVDFPGVSQSSLFQHAGGEMIFGLPNGLQAYYVTDTIGHILVEAPTSIVSNHAAAEVQDSAVILNGVGSCQWCHSVGIIEKSDELRALADADRFAPAAVNDHVRRLHPAGDALRTAIAADTARHVAAYTRAAETDLPPADGGRDIVIRLARLFEKADVTLIRAAAELGLSDAELRQAIDALPPGSPVSAALQPLVADQSIKRALFAERFAAIVCALGLNDCAPTCGVPERCRIPGSSGPLGGGEPCVSGTTCDDGRCVSACDPACPTGQRCVERQCVEDPGPTCVPACGVGQRCEGTQCVDVPPGEALWDSAIWDAAQWQ